MASGLAYGSAELADLRSFARPASGAGRLKATSLSLARRPSRARTLLSLRDLPIVELRMSAAEHDRWLHARWPAGGESLFDGHWAQAVIQTSVKEHEYLAGRHRQAVRTNIRRARELGITATRLGGYDEFAAASAPVYRSRSGGDAVLAATREPPPDEFAWYSASTVAHEAPIIVAAVALFGDFAVLAVMVGNQDYARIGYARYLLHTFILGDLAAHGIRHLIVGSVLRESNGNQYFQRLLGYRICNVQPILLPSAGAQRGNAAAAMRRLLMTGPAVEAATSPRTNDAQGVTSPASAGIGRPEWLATGGGGYSSTPKVAVTTVAEERKSAL
ncbi:MAG: hypothetical protein WAU77_05720 [Solirubrobacteraceae bacterium]